MDKLIRLAFEEDIGSGDITTESSVPEDYIGHGQIIAKESLILAGLEMAKKVFSFYETDIFFKEYFQDGDRVKNGETIIYVKGNLRNLLTCERIALNFLQRLSGIATHVRSYIDELGDNKTLKILDTRKTIPGWRFLEKYAVKAGGAYNHRMGLYDQVLIKDNHIAVCGGVKNAVEKTRKNSSKILIEVEVKDFEQLKEALDAKANVIMLDNMNYQQICEAVKIINKKALVEVSGNITKENLKLFAQTGVDFISIGALTHSARFVDMSMRISEEKPASSC